MFGPTLNWKLGNMRKPQEFIVVSCSEQSDRVTIQSDKSIGQFLLETGQGILNTRGSVFVYLDKRLGAKPYTLSPEQLAEVKKAIEAIAEKNKAKAQELINRLG